MPEAVHLRDLLRIWVRPDMRLTPSPPDFQGLTRAHRMPLELLRFPGRGPLSREEPIPGCPALHKEKRTLPGAPASFSGFVCVTSLRHSGFWDLNRTALLLVEAYLCDIYFLAVDGRVWAQRYSAIHFQG